MKRFFSGVVCAFFILAVANAQAPPAPSNLTMVETISVTGMGRVTLVPDRFTFTVGVQTTVQTLEEAVTQNNVRVASVIAALKKAGATDSEIHTSNFSIFPQQDYKDGAPPRILGYQVNNSIVVTKSQISEAGRLLQVAINAGVNQSSGLSFQVSDPRRGRDEGLRMAVEDARAKATLLAQAAGRTLGRVLAISEGGAAEPPRPMMAYAAQARAGKSGDVGEVPVEGGSQEASFMISVVFGLR